MQKLRNLEVPNFLINWICCFLRQRHQCVKFDSIKSNWLEIWGNVPQGTLLGILLFIIMINDLKTSSPTFKFVDTTLFDISNSINDNLQLSVDIIYDWSVRNNMKINLNKTKEMIICFRKDIPDIPNIKKITMFITKDLSIRT